MYKLKVTKEKSRTCTEDYSIDSEDFPIRKISYEQNAPNTYEEMKIFGGDNAWFFKARKMDGKITHYDLKTRDTLLAGMGDMKFPQELGQLEQAAAEQLGKKLSKRARVFFDMIIERARDSKG